jgi:hypothetical protein|tara:strand:+ start:402 stop:608 length:207 start_codon:yes stop_codon:yes gene_type:complete
MPQDRNALLVKAVEKWSASLLDMTGTNRFPIPGLDVGIDCHTCENYEGGPAPLFSGRVSDWFDELWNN